jgi:hypothetical protein
MWGFEMVSKNDLTLERGTEIYRMVRKRNYTVLITAIVFFLLGVYLFYGYLFPSTYTAYINGQVSQVPQNRQDISGVIIFDIPFMILGAYGGYLFVTRTRDMSRQPDVKRFLSFSDPQQCLDQFEDEISGDQVVRFKDSYFTPTFLVRESFFRIRWAKFSEVTWAYEQRTRNLLYFIPLNTTFKIIVHVDKRYQIHLDCQNDKEAKTVLKKLTEAAPNALFGFTPEMKQAWYRDNEGVRKVLAAKAQQASANESQFQGQVDELFVALDKNDVARSVVIIDAMGKIRNKLALEPLTILIEDRDESVWRHTVEALGNIGSAAVVGPLVKALNDRSESIRISAALALGKIGDTRAVPALEAMAVPAKNSQLYLAKLKAIEQINLKNM